MPTERTSQQKADLSAQESSADQARFDAGNRAGIKYGLVPWLSAYYGRGVVTPTSASQGGVVEQRGSATLKLLPKTPIPSNWLIKDVRIRQKVGESTECTFKLYPRAKTGGAARNADRGALAAIIDDPALEFGTPWAIGLGYHDPGLANYKYEAFRGCITAKRPHFSQGVHYLDVTLHSASYWLQFHNGIPSSDMPDEYTRLNAVIDHFDGLRDFIGIRMMKNPSQLIPEKETSGGGGSGNAGASNSSMTSNNGGSDGGVQKGTTGGGSQNLFQALNDYASKNGFILVDRGPEIVVGPMVAIARPKGKVFYPSNGTHKGPVFHSFEPEQTVWTLYSRVIVQWIPPYAGGKFKAPIRAMTSIDMDNPATVASGIVPNGGDLVVTNMPVQSEAEALQLCYLLHSGQLVQDTKASLSMPGSFIVVGDMITVMGSEIGAYWGDYFVDEAVHNFDDSGYKLDLGLTKIPKVDPAALLRAKTGTVEKKPFDAGSKGAVSAAKGGK